MAAHSLIGYVLFLLFVCCYSTATYSLTCYTADNPDSTWIETPKDYTTLRVTQSTDVEKIGVLTDPNDVRLSPNANSITGFHLAYKFVVIQFGLKLKFIPGNDDEVIRGKTKLRSFGFGFQHSHWIQSLNYTRTKGYYLENTVDYNKAWVEGMPYIQFPDLVVNSYSGSTAYKVNDRYSVNAITVQTERQLRSAGSLMPSLLYRYYVVNDKRPNAASSQKSNNLEMILNAAYLYTLVLKTDFYLSTGVSPGVGFTYTRLTTRFPSGPVLTNSIAPVVRLDGRLGLGYNGKRFFGGMFVSVFAGTYRQQNTTVVNYDNRITGLAFVGYRFNTPAFVKKQVKMMEEEMKEKNPF